MGEWGLPGLDRLDATHSVLWEFSRMRVGLSLTRSNLVKGGRRSDRYFHDAMGMLLASHLLSVRA